MELNISLDGEDILLEPDRCYFVMDALYLKDVKEMSGRLDKKNLDEELRYKVFQFPKTETPFAKIVTPKIKSDVFRFRIQMIKNGDSEEPTGNSFSSDSGLILIVKESILSEFSNTFDYDMVVNSLLNPIDLAYWSQIQELFGKLACGIILSPGIKKGFDFQGSGLYQIEM